MTESSNKRSAKRSESIAVHGILIALAVVLSYVEHAVPLSTAVPGIKAGFANIAVIYALYRYGIKSAVFVSAVRILLLFLLFGNAASLWYSISGAVLSITLMSLLSRCPAFSEIGVSVCGGVCHNFGQILAAILLMGTVEIAYYLPVLIITGTVAGIAVGLISAVLLNRTFPKKQGKEPALPASES